MAHDVEVITDSREPKKYQLAVAALVPVKEVKALHSGDWSIVADGVRLGIERKTCSDFLGSLKSGRLESQFLRMNDDYDIRVLMMDGPWSIVGQGKIKHKSRELGWHVSSYLMAIYSLTRKYDVTPIWVPDVWGCAWAVRSFYRRALQKGLGSDTEGGTIESWEIDASTLSEEPPSDDLRTIKPTKRTTTARRSVAPRPRSKRTGDGPLGWSETVRELTRRSQGTTR